MIKKEGNILVAKSNAFSDRIIKLYQYLEHTSKEMILSKQILRSGTSIGANIAESQGAQSTADFIHKLEIALKEAKETAYWLDKLLTGNYITVAGHTSMYHDNLEIIKLLSAILIAKKKKAKR